MELLKLLVELVRAMAWPGVVIFLIIYLNRQGGDSFKRLLESISRKSNFRAKVAGAEIELSIVDKLQQDIKEIAKEPDQEKRLQLAKKALAVDDAIRQMDEKDFEFLKKYHSESRFFVTDLYVTGMSDEELNSYNKLAKLRLIHGYPVHGGESIDYITTAGEEVLQKLTKNPMQ